MRHTYWNCWPEHCKRCSTKKAETQPFQSSHAAHFFWHALKMTVSLQVTCRWPGPTQASILCASFAVWPILDSSCGAKKMPYQPISTEAIKNVPHGGSSAKYGRLREKTCHALCWLLCDCALHDSPDVWQVLYWSNEPFFESSLEGTPVAGGHLADGCRRCSYTLQFHSTRVLGQFQEQAGGKYSKLFE